MTTLTFDMVVIGGGINGAGIARDATLRGLSVLLLEKNDFGSGTSSWSSRLIHGGLRYLEYGEIPLVFESLHERRRLRQVAPHLISELRLNIPIYKGARRSAIVVRLGMIAYDLLSFGKKIPSHRMLSREQLLAEEPALNQEGLTGGAQYYDAQVNFAERLVLENVLAARDAGADVRNYSPVIGLNVRHGEMHSVHFVDGTTGDECEAEAAAVVNATGPWVDRVLATVNREMPTFMGGTKGSHIVVGAFPGAPRSAFYVEARQDGRPFFIIPWNGQYLIGTTDIRYDGDPGNVVVSEEEIDYLLDETNRVFPIASLARDDIHYTYSGVRPLPKRSGGPESAITRKHIIHRHKKDARGLYSIIGGKLTTYRNLAEQVVDVVVRKAKLEAKDCVTRTLPLPGGINLGGVRASLSAMGDLSPECVERLLGIYGSRAIDIVGSARSKDDSLRYLDEGRTVLAAEIEHAIRNEAVRHLTDIVHRRMMVGLSADQGRAMQDAIAVDAGKLLGWDGRRLDRERKELRAYNDRLAPFRAAD